jgi:Nif-specific regulatory protein
MNGSELIAEYGGKRRNAEVALLGVYEISKVLTAPVRLDEALGRVANLLSSFLDLDHGLIALLNDDGTPDLVFGSHCDSATAQREFAQLPVQVIGRIVVTQMPLLIENVKEDPLFAAADIARSPAADSASGQLCLSFVGVPIKDRGRVIGTLSIDREWKPAERRDFRFDDDVRFLTMVANLVGQTVRLQRMVARDRERLLEDRSRLEKRLGASAAPEALHAQIAGIVGESAALRSVLEKIRIVARSQTSVLLRGESGTGKELFARALHDLSLRKEQPFITLNCAALSESVLESELFGHEKGAFTGANNQRKGRFELADKGTLFLDEIGEISGSFQAKLLRVLQLGEFERVGGGSTLKVDVRLVAATNRNLEEAVANGSFRADLYYRISVVPIRLPPLRERPTDIPLLAREFLLRFNKENATDLVLTDAAMSVLSACCFPGNVRELENCVRRTATLAVGLAIEPADFACRNDECLSATLWKQDPTARPAGFVPLPLSRGPLRPRPASADARDSSTDGTADGELSDDWSELAGNTRGERERLIEVMESVGWVQAKAARVLGLTPRQVGYALRKHEIPIKKF